MNQIRELLQPRSVSSDTRLVLTNAIYFKGNWEEQFKKEDTKNEDFRLSATRAIKTPLMHMTKGFYYFDGGLLQALEIPYKNKVPLFLRQCGNVRTPTKCFHKPGLR